MTLHAEKKQRAVNVQTKTCTLKLLPLVEKQRARALHVGFFSSGQAACSNPHRRTPPYEASHRPVS
jgi:hypothetical protein